MARITASRETTVSAELPLHSHAVRAVALIFAVATGACELPELRRGQFACGRGGPCDAACVGCADATGRDAHDDASLPDTVGPRDAAGRRDAPSGDVGMDDRGDAVVSTEDAGAPTRCTTTCECEQGLGCLGGLCRTAGVGSIWCCDNPGCPTGEPCLDIVERPSTCPAHPDAGVPDASAAGGIGAACAADLDCDRAMGLTCWEQAAAPTLWGGYCTLEGCSPVCPPDSVCITFNAAMAQMGCMRTCNRDSDCRADAYCLTIPNSAVQICLPDCRDDLFHCAPRDGTTFCSAATGRCEPTPAQTPGASVGDPCADNRDCGSGDVCLGEVAWGLSGGACTRVCSTLPEATPCGASETCRTLAGIGLCFRDCDQMRCPNRPGAVCQRLDPSWQTEACLPP